MELREVDKEIEEAMKEHKEYYDRLSKMIVEYKKLKEQTAQSKQLKQYMPLILSHKKMNMEKEVREFKKDTEDYIYNVKKQCLLLEDEINKVKQRIQVLVDSLSQLFVLRDLKEFEDLIRHFDQVLEEYRLQEKLLDSSKVAEELFSHNEVEELDSIKEFLVSDNDSYIEEPSVRENENDILQEIAPSKIAASVKDPQQDFKKEKITAQKNVNFPVQDDEIDELTQLLKQLI